VSFCACPVREINPARTPHTCFHLLPGAALRTRVGFRSPLLPPSVPPGSVQVERGAGGGERKEEGLVVVVVVMSGEGGEWVMVTVVSKCGEKCMNEGPPTQLNQPTNHPSDQPTNLLQRSLQLNIIFGQCRVFCLICLSFSMKHLHLGDDLAWGARSSSC
jgi:hypothetical protein